MKLAEWLKKEGKTDAWLAEQVGRDRSFITKIRKGDALPSIGVAAVIQRVTGGAVTALDYEQAKPARLVQEVPAGETA